MATQLSSYPSPRQTIEVKTGVLDDDATIQSTSGLVVFNTGVGGTFTVPAPATQAQINQARLALQKLPAPAPPDSSELSFLNADGQAYVVNFPDGNVLTFSGTQGEMATITLFQGTYNLKSATNQNTTFVLGTIPVIPPTFGGTNQPA